MEEAKLSFKYEEICAALLCLYFSAHLNKTQFAKILEFSAVTSQNIFPKSFNECSNVLLNLFDEKIEREKKWYCTSCKSRKSKFYIHHI